MTRDWTLIIHPGALGDVLLALPAIRVIRAATRSRVALCARRDAATLLLECREADAVLAMEGPALANLLSGDASIACPQSGLLERCRTAVCWMKDTAALRDALLQRGVPEIIFHSPFATDLSGHQSERFLQTIASIVTPGETRRDPLAVPARWRLSASDLRRSHGLNERPLLMIHPGSGSRHKCVDPSIWSDVLRWAAQFGLQPCMLEGPADREIVAAVQRLGSHLPVIHESHLGVVAALLADAALYIGHDSGISHLAAWAGSPTVVLFGPTDAARWQPLEAHVAVVQGEHCHCTAWAEVQACVDKPCLRIAPQSIFAACERLLPRHCLVPSRPLC